MKLNILIILLFISLSILMGCAAAPAFVEDRLAQVIDTYCKAPAETRVAVRNEVNRAVAPNDIQINCSDGD